MVLQLTTPPPKKKCSTEPSTQNSTLQKWEALEKMAFSHMYVQMFTACVCVSIYIYMYTVCMYIYIYLTITIKSPLLTSAIPWILLSIQGKRNVGHFMTQHTDFPNRRCPPRVVKARCGQCAHPG